LSSAWGRIFFLYGPGEHRDKLVASVLSSLLQGQEARCTHGNQVRDFLHVEDVASAFVALLDSKVEGAVNIASGQPITIRDVVLLAADQFAARERVEFGANAAPENEPPLLVADVRRLRDEVGWSPAYQIGSGLEQTARWWESQLQGTGKK
jgi:nucleoside-diphosphate-sugar epimerase